MAYVKHEVALAARYVSARRHDWLDEFVARMDADLDGREYVCLELAATAWRRWSYYAAKGDWQ